MTKPSSLSVLILILAGMACSGSDAVLVGNSVMAAAAALDLPVMSGADGIPGWKRTGPLGRYDKEGLYGYIDGGAEIVLQYGFREASVAKYRPAEDPGATKEIALEIYRMTSGEAAFGLYSTKLEGGESGWPGVKADNWIAQGQASFVKGEFLVNILGPECTERELGEFAAALEPKVPGAGTVRPKGLDWLPAEGRIPTSRRYLKGPLAAQNESPFLEGGFWGFMEAPGRDRAAEAFSARYGAAPAFFRLVIVKLGSSAEPGSIEDGILASFGEYLRNVRREAGLIEGRNEAGRWFLFQRSGPVAALVLGDPDRASALSRLETALARAIAKTN
jgi:hypothetical protein